MMTVCRRTRSGSSLSDGQRRQPLAVAFSGLDPPLRAPLQKVSLGVHGSPSMLPHGRRILDPLRPPTRERAGLEAQKFCCLPSRQKPPRGRCLVGLARLCTTVLHAFSSDELKTAHRDPLPSPYRDRIGRKEDFLRGLQNYF